MFKVTEKYGAQLEIKAQLSIINKSGSAAKPRTVYKIIREWVQSIGNE